MYERTSSLLQHLVLGVVVKNHIAVVKLLRFNFGFIDDSDDFWAILTLPPPQKKKKNSRRLRFQAKKKIYFFFIRLGVKAMLFIETSFSECFLNVFITCCNIFITYESFNIHEFSMFCAPIVNQEIYQ